MKIIEKVLKNKLASFGFDVERISNQLSQMDFGVIENQIGLESEADKYIIVKKYDEPTVEISRALVNYSKYYIQNLIVAGNINFSTTSTSIGTAFPVVDYSLSEKVCIVATTIALNVEVIIYSPSDMTKTQYGSQTYEDLVAKERNAISQEYYEAFVENGRVPENKVKSIMALLLAEHIIDEMTILDENPKIKMYDNPDAYAENITEYRLKYINRRTNRIEIAIRPTYIKKLGVNVSAGLVSNDPYIKLDSIPEGADFPLNSISCYWTNQSNRKKDEVSIYIATKNYGDAKTYKEYREKNAAKYDEIVNSLQLQFERETGKEVKRDFIESILKKLNPELVHPSVDIIRDCMENPSDQIETLKYKFKATSDARDFEEKLYISIEDNIGKRYKYKLTENVLNDLTRIGNKLEYTDEKGSIVRKQSVADFNINTSTAIIRRETLIDYTKIPGLLGYIYEDMEYLGTDMLPVPSLEVDVYIPPYARNDVSMFNGTNIMADYAEISSYQNFNSIETDSKTSNIPGTTYAIVRYVNSLGEVLKENTINNLYPGTPYVPEILPIISDTEGKEWVCATTQYPSTVINIIPEYNVIEIKYKEKFSKVTITFLSREGKKICDDVVETVQAGTTYDISKKMQYTDEQNNDWRLVSSRPQKLLVKDNDDNNHLILIYDIEKQPVTLKLLKPNGDNIVEPSVNEVQVGKMYSVALDRIVIDSDGIGWVYNGPNPIEHLVEEDKDNIVEVKYEEYKLPVTVKYQSQDNIIILNDFVEYVQVGKTFIPPYEKETNDIKLREWKYKEGAPSEFRVSKDEKKNVIKIIYEPLLANVFIQILNESGDKILNPIQKQCQIGEEFASVYMNEITDNFGKMWVKKEEPQALVVSKNETENNIVIKYQPLIATVVVKFFDEDRNELIPSKSYEKQAGTLFKPEIIEKLESRDGRKWFLDKNKVEEITVKKNMEENIVSIFYGPEVTDIILTFEDAYGNKLRDSVTVQGQIGSIYNPKSFEKIEDKSGYKWMIESTTPQKLLVKNSENEFKFIYGEVKAVVVVKHINVNDNKTILDDIVAKVKLGGVYIPNIQEKVYDSNKFLWKFIGDKNISIVVKENEQENIVLLQYDEARAKVNVKYQDLYNNILRDDVSYELQIGKNIDNKSMEKFIDNNGIGWALHSTKPSSNKVIDGENEVINFYDPLKVNVQVRYINEKEKEITESKSEKIQIGRTFEIPYEKRIKDFNDLLWQYKSGADETIKVNENGNIINVVYSPVLSNVVERYFSKSGEEIKTPVKKLAQVGSVVEFLPSKEIIDDESRKWKFLKIDKSSIIVQEKEESNIVNEFFEEKLNDVVVRIYNDVNEEIAEPKKYMVQIGSKYQAELTNIFIDSKTKLGWVLPENVQDTIIVSEEKEKNIIPIKYEKYLVGVKDKIVDMKGEEILPAQEKKLQVGSTYSPKIDKDIKDAKGREWYYGKKRDKNLFMPDEKPINENISIIVSDNPDKNIVMLKYNPSLAEVVVKYEDNLGNAIAKSEVFEAQIGSEYTPEIRETIKDSKKNKWVYNPNSKSSIVISRDETKNIITLSYEEEKAPIIYKYQDELKNRLKSPKKELAQIGSVYIPEVENVIEDEHGKVWEYKETNVDKIEVKDSEQENVIEITYIPLLTEIELNLKNRKGELIAVQTEKAQLGSLYSPNVEERVFDENSMMFKFVKCEPQEITVKEVPIGSEEKVNVFNITYEPVYSNVVIVFQDIDGNKLKDDETIQLQVGTKYTPKLIQYVTDRIGIQWENITTEVETIRVKENPKDNIIKMTYEVAKAEVLIRYRDIDGNTIKEAKHFQEKIGTEYIPEIEDVIIDSKNRKWIYSSSDPVKITVGSINNIINLIYQEKKVPVVIKYETTDGRKLRADVTENVQEGVQFIPKKNFAIIYDEDEIWRYLEFRPSSLLVTDKISENVIVQVYDNKVEETSEKTKLVNPFANTLTEEEKIEEEEREKKLNEKSIEIDLNNKASSIKTDELFTAKTLDEHQNLETDNAVKDSNNGEVVFIEPNLIELSKSVLLDDAEKTTIIKLNEMNISIIKELDRYKNNFDAAQKDKVLHEIDEYMVKEKEIIQNELSTMLAEDKTGKKFLKILEAIVEPDKDYQKLQERKVILLTDYFVNTDVSTVEQATYICERGKSEKELLILEAKINEDRKNKEELQELFVNLVYERAMLDSYYKTRTKSKDEYFTNPDERASISNDVVIMVTNMLPKQAFSLLQKSSLNTVQQNELDAIINLLTSQQRGTLEKLVADIKDGKLRKEMTKRLKDIR